MPSPFPYREYIEKLNSFDDRFRNINSTLIRVQLRLTELEKRVDELYDNHFLRTKVK